MAEYGLRSPRRSTGGAALEHGAKAVTGVDISEKMLTMAKKKTDRRIRYIHMSMEDIVFDENSFDVVVSSLAFHYIESFEQITKKVSGCLTPGGYFVFSVEHPVFTAYGSQDWIYDEEGNILHFPVDHYFSEGKRNANFLGESVVKYHRTLTTYLNGLLQGGFELTGVVEPQPPAYLLHTVKGMEDELRRPLMLIISSRKKQ
jgi:SAM-dependent methyltransferase